MHRLPRTVRVLVALAFLPLAGARAQGRVAGTVVDARFRPVEGAVISIVGRPDSARTNGGGAFRFESVSGASVSLRVQRLGFAPLTTTVRVGDTSVRLTIQELPINLNAVVVTGTAGATEKRTVGNAVAQVAVADIVETAPVRDIGQLLNARASGVVITPPGGLAGGGSRVLIRGRSSFSLNSDPIVYVDGVRVNGDGPLGGNGANAISRLNDFNPDDIESVEIIKGPAASTLYGTEASNGVIQIITKRGKTGPARFELSTRQGTGWFMDYVNRWLTSYYRDPVTNERPGFNLAKVESDAGRPLFHTGYQQGYQGSVSGGGDATQYYAASNYDVDEGVQPHDASNRFGGRANLTLHPRPSFDINGDIGISLLRNQLADGGQLMFDALLGRPLNRNTPSRGFNRAPSEVWKRTTFADQNTDRFTGSADFNHRITPWLSQRLRTGVDYSNINNITLQKRMSALDARFFSATTAAGSKTITQNGVLITTVDYNASATHDLFGLATTTTGGFQYFRRNTNLLSANGQQFPSTDVVSIAGAAQRIGSSDQVENVTVGGYGQEQLGWRDRLYLTGAVRFDRNSAFGSGFKSVAYPKVSASWVVNEEPWWHLKSVDNFRLRGAYGASGQQPQAFAALRTFQPVTGQAGAPAVSPQFVGNPDLGPEKSRELELGFESSMFAQRAGIDFTWYNKTTSDAIVLRDVAPSSGFPQQQFVNLGEIRNRGVELLLTARPVQTRNTSWDLRFNVSHNANEVQSLGLGNTKFLEFGFGNRFQPGFPVYAAFARKVVSADRGPDGKPINIKCDGGTPSFRAGGPPVDCATAPRVYVGKPDPSVEGSLSSSFTLARRLTFSGLVDFKRGHRTWSSSLWCPGILGCYEKLYPEQVSPLLASHSVLGYTDDAEWWKDISFTKLREISVNYLLPDRVAHRIVQAQRASVSVAARNLHTWTAFKGLDPENVNAFPNSATFGTIFEQNELPQLATFMFRLNLSF
jgi:TonB-linked SusC/RagA family outer membrane protein